MRGNKLFCRAVLIAAISMLPSLATPAGLGKINVLSALGQPLLAEIDLVSVSAEEFPSLAATLASQDAYREANVEYPNNLGGFRFVIAKRANGQAYLRVVSNQPVNEPFIDLLIELNWASGRLLREYPVLLDPPGYNVAKPQAPTITPPQVATPSPRTKPAPSVAAQPLRTQPPTTAGSEKPSMSASEKAAGEASDTYGPVRSGETLGQIAGSMRQADVSLEQILVALYRENKGAFVGRNMNRLKTGMILKVPPPSEAAAVSPRSAKREVIAQTVDWNAYRKRLAGAATQGESSGQTASGAIDTKISDKAAPPDSGKDVLKLSKGQVATGKAGAAGSLAGQDKLNSLQEELATRDKALEDARARITMLENEIGKMRQLLELKGTPLPADKPPVMDNPPTSSTAVVSPPVAPKPVEMASKPVVVPEPPPAAPDMASNPVGEEPPAKPKKPKRVTPPAPPPDQPGFLEGLLENPLIPVAGAAILALLGFLGYNQFRKRKDAQLGAFTAPVPGGFKIAPAAAPATLFPDDGNSSFLTDFDKVGAGNIDTDEVDPVAEADVYIAYGRDAQAEEILKEANAKDPTRYEIPLKLLEIYANRKSTQSFETVAKQLNGTIGTQHPLWFKVAEMGRKLDANNPLYAPVALSSDIGRSGESTVMRALTGVAAAAEKPYEQVPNAMKDTLTVKEPVIENAPLDFDLDFNTAPAPTASDGALAANLSPNTGILDFDLGEAGGATSGDVDFSTGESSTSADPFVLDFDLEASSPTPANREEAPSFPPAANADIAADFYLDAAPASEQSPKVMASTASAQPDLELGSAVDLPPLDLSGIDLSLGSGSPAMAGAAAQTGGNWQSAETKMDLARAYLEIGDKVGAVEILQEVIIEGSPEQQEEAKKLAAQA